MLDGKSSVELKLREPRQLFDERDPAPFRDRDLDDDAARYILNSYRELSDQHDVKLSLYFESLGELSDDPRVIERAIHAFFRFEAEVKRRELRDLVRTGLVSLMIGLTFLTMCTGFAHHFGDVASASFGKSLLKEGLMLMGWVSMWKPISIFLYEWWPIRASMHDLQELSVIEVEVRELKPELVKPTPEVARPSITMPILPLGAALPGA
ncbi:MAG: hypothetical protein V4760_12390 [Bdellovibrionota bacterium]